MPANPPASVRDLYRECAAQLGECYCSITRSGVCYRPPEPPVEAGETRAYVALSLAFLGVAVWPLGPVAWLLGRSARARLPWGPGGARRAARWAYVIGLAETLWLCWVAYVILVDRL